MLIRRRRRGLRFPAAMDLDQPLKFMCALAALFYPTFRHCSSWTIPQGIVTLAKYSRLSSRFGSAMSALSR
jgi:hypothetical protein